MKILCNVCEAAEATLLCCADEAALCCACDERVHAVNKLANKHQRVSLSSSSSRFPKCDVCQEAAGYFFCLEDRALLCRKCDVSIHTANNFVASHQRFLLTGVKLGLEAAEPGSSSPPRKILEPDICPVLEKPSAPVSTNSEYSKQLPKKVSEIEDLLSTRTPLAGGAGAGSIRQWQFDEFLGLDDGNRYLSYMENGSSKANGWKVGDSDSCAILRSGELDGDDYLSQVPDASWAVPEIPSPPHVASGLYWPEVHHDLTDSTVYVPDISGSSLRNMYDYQYQPQGPNLSFQRLF